LGDMLSESSNKRHDPVLGYSVHFQ
jgi:hypothetical protein